MTTGNTAHSHTVKVAGKGYVTSAPSHSHDDDSAALTARLDALEARVAALEAPVEPEPLTGHILFGAFDDANTIADPVKWRAALEDLRAHGITSLATTNGFVRYQEGLLDISDELGFEVVTSQLMGDLIDTWYPSSVPATIEAARSIVGPLVDQLAPHPSVVGHNILDDATPTYNEKVRLALQVIRERAPHQLASPTINEVDPGGIIAYTQPTALLLYNYPCRVSNTACSWVTDWLTAVRAGIALAPAGAPVWFILSTHSTEHWGTSPARVRYPSVEELRLGTWLVLGEGVKGVWYFTYTSQQGWTGFRDNPPLYAELTDLAGRVRSVEGVLGRAVRVPHEVTTDAGYAATFRDGADTYALIVNTSCSLRTVSTSRPMLGLTRFSLRGGDAVFGELT